MKKRIGVVTNVCNLRGYSLVAQHSVVHIEIACALLSY